MNQRGEQHSKITSDLESMRRRYRVYWTAFAIGVGVTVAEAYPQWWLGLVAGAFVGSGFVLVIWFLWEPLSLVGEGLRWVWSKLFPPD